jgi:hypothetical protein
MQTNDFQPKLEALISRYRGLEARPSRLEVENLYTEGCAELLRLEAELLRLMRRARAADADRGSDPEAAQEARDLHRRLADLNAEVAEVRQLVRLLRTGVDWAQAQAS